MALESWEVWLSNAVKNGAQNRRNKTQAVQELTGSALNGTWIASGDNTRYYNFVVPRMAQDPAVMLERPIPIPKKYTPNRL